MKRVHCFATPDLDPGVGIPCVLWLSTVISVCSFFTSHDPNKFYSTAATRCSVVLFSWFAREYCPCLMILWNKLYSVELKNLSGGFWSLFGLCQNVCGPNSYHCNKHMISINCRFSVLDTFCAASFTVCRVVCPWTYTCVGSGGLWSPSVIGLVSESTSSKLLLCSAARSYITPIWTVGRETYCVQILRNKEKAYFQHKALIAKYILTAWLILLKIDSW